MAHSKRPRRLNYVVNKKRRIRGDKLKKAIKHFQKLISREKIEWTTLWLEKAKMFAMTRLKKYWINHNNI